MRLAGAGRWIASGRGSLPHAASSGATSLAWRTASDEAPEPTGSRGVEPRFGPTGGIRAGRPLEAELRRGDAPASRAKLRRALDRGRSGQATVCGCRLCSRPRAHRVLRDDADAPQEGPQHRDQPERVVRGASRVGAPRAAAPALRPIPGHGRDPAPTPRGGNEGLLVLLPGTHDPRDVRALRAAGRGEGLLPPDRARAGDVHVRGRHPDLAAREPDGARRLEDRGSRRARAGPLGGTRTRAYPDAMGSLLLAAGILALAAYLAWQRRSPRPFPPWMTPLLHSPWRRRRFSPQIAADRHGIASGMVVLEVGPGDGYLTGAAIARTAPGGWLVCLDVQLGMLRKLRKALGSGTPPLVCASGAELPFRAHAFDLVFLTQVLGEIPDRAAALVE